MSKLSVTEASSLIVAVVGVAPADPTDPGRLIVGGLGEQSGGNDYFLRVSGPDAFVTGVPFSVPASGMWTFTFGGSAFQPGNYTAAVEPNGNTLPFESCSLSYPSAP